MSKISRIQPDQREVKLANLPGWQYDAERDSIRREFRFADFAQAFGFMSELALVSERSNHHPEWFNVYSRVDVTLTTHDAGGVSQRDIDWADAADKIFQRFADVPRAD